MAAFTDKEMEDQWPIWQLFQNGGVVLFHQQAILDAATDELNRNAYQVHNIDCQPDMDYQAVLFAIVDSLKIPRYPNIGLDGFNDFISQIDFDGCTGPDYSFPTYVYLMDQPLACTEIISPKKSLWSTWSPHRGMISKILGR